MEPTRKKPATKTSTWEIKLRFDWDDSGKSPISWNWDELLEPARNVSVVSHQKDVKLDTVTSDQIKTFTEVLGHILTVSDLIYPEWEPNLALEYGVVHLKDLDEGIDFEVPFNLIVGHKGDALLQAKKLRVIKEQENIVDRYNYAVKELEYRVKHAEADLQQAEALAQRVHQEAVRRLEEKKKEAEIELKKLDQLRDTLK